MKATIRGTLLLMFLLGTPVLTINAQEQTHKAEKVYASFFSETPVENIEANPEVENHLLRIRLSMYFRIVFIKAFY